MKNTDRKKNEIRSNEREKNVQKSGEHSRTGENKYRRGEPCTPRNYRSDDHDIWNKKSEW